MQLVLDYLAANSTALVTTTALFGLFLGSFLNVVIHRFPIMLDREWRTAAKEILEGETVATDESDKPAYNLIVPRSACPKCGHHITAIENIPVLSYLFLRGRCRGCKTPISMRYPAVELLTGLLFGYAAMHFGYQPLLLAILTFIALLVVLTFIDIDTQLLPDVIVYCLLWLGLLVNSFGLITDLNSAVLGAFFGYMSLWSIFWGFKLLTGKEGMGYGDFKLLAALGAWLGWQKLLLIILISSVVGAILGALTLWLSKKESSTTLPFGPYLAIAGLISLFWGDSIVTYYLKQIGM